MFKNKKFLSFTGKISLPFGGPKVNQIIQVVCLALVFFIAFTIRILPLKWGAYLSEFDPYWHWYVAQHVANNGVSWIFTDSWIDTRTWFPYGRHVASTTPMGLPLTAVAFYQLIKGFNVSLLDVAIWLPPFMAAVTCIALYFWGRDVGGSETGILAALFLALNSAYIGRTTLGFFKHECVGIFAIVLASFLFLRAVKPENSFKKGLIYSIMAGLALAYLNISWGAFYYMFGLIPLFVFVALIIQRYTSKILIFYLVTMGISILLALPFPRPGLGVLSTMGAIPTLAGFIVLAMYEALNRLRFKIKIKFKFMPIILCIIVAAIVSAGIYLSGLAGPITGKFLAVVNPVVRSASPIIESVAEHRMSTWSSFYHGFGNLIFLAPVGFYFAFKRGKLEDIYLILFGLTSLYFASSYIRLNLILSPVLCLLAAYGLTQIAKPVMKAVKASWLPVKKKVVPSINPIAGLAFLFILILALTPTFMQALENAYSPVTIASASTPLREHREDWFDALEWINENVPEGVPVVCWWDYGYWVAIAGNSTSVADNATINTTQIAHIGQVLLSNETIAFNLSKKYFKSDYILAFVTTFPVYGQHRPWGYGDEGKWVWMARIAHGYHPEISEETVDRDKNGLPDENTLLGKIILYACGFPVNFEAGKIVYVSPSHEYVVKGEQKITTQIIIVKGIS